MDNNHWRRVMLKISGEALMGKGNYGLEPEMIEELSNEIKEAHLKGYEICIVVGGGNIFRGVGSEELGITRDTGDHMGMLATMINALALQSMIEKLGLKVRLQSAIEINSVAEPFIIRRALRHLEKGRIVIFGAGLGIPFHSTDSAAAQRAVEMKCDIMFKATKVDGIYTSDPKKDADAKRFDHISYKQALDMGLKVMDAGAIIKCEENKIPIGVFSIFERGQLGQVLSGLGKFTLVS